MRTTGTITESYTKYIFWLLIGLLFLIPVAFSRSLMDIFGLPKVGLLWLGAGLLALLTAVGLVAGRRFLFPKGRLGWLLIGFVLVIGLATANSINPVISVFGNRQSYMGLLTYLSGAIIFYAAWSCVDSRRLKIFVISLVAAACPVALLALAQRFGLKYPFDYSAWMTDRVGSTIGNPNFLGVYLAMTLPLAIGLALSDDARFRAQRAVWWLLAALSVGALVTTNSLGAWLAAAVAASALIVTYSWPNQSRRNRAAIVIVASGLGLTLTIPLLVYSNASATLAERLAIWQGGVGAVLKAPFLGTGPDTMRFIMPSVQPMSLGGKVYGDAHNLFITLGATAGLPALAVFILLLVTIIGARGGAYGPDKALIIALKAALVAYVIGQQFNPESIAPMALFWAMAGVVARQGIEPADIAELKSTIPGSIAAAVAGAFCIWLASVSVLLWQAESYIKLADRQPDLNIAWHYASKAQDSWPYYGFYALFLFDRSAPYIGKDPNVTQTATTMVDGAVTYNRLEADSYYARGEIHRLLAAKADKKLHREEALRQYKEALRLNPLKLPANYEIAKLYLAKDDKAQARRHLDLLLKLVPADDEHRPELIALRKKAE